MKTGREAAGDDRYCASHLSDMVGINRSSPAKTSRAREQELMAVNIIGNRSASLKLDVHAGASLASPKYPSSYMKLLLVSKA